MKGDDRKGKVLRSPSRKKVFTNIFSREKTLLYFCVWDESDSKGIVLAGGKIKNNLFLIPPKGRKGSVWYEKKELALLKKKVLDSMKEYKNNSFWIKLKKLMKTSWDFLEPYAEGHKEINDVKEFNSYYNHMVDFWTCLNSFICYLIDNSKVDELIKKELFSFRDETEPYTEKISSVMIEYLEKQPLLKDITSVVTKTEAEDIIKNKINADKLSEIKKRLNGCFMLNKKVYSINEIEAIMKENNMVFERQEGGKDLIRGISAFGGLVRGCVKVVHSFKDLNKLKEGDVFITEMTNPKYVSALNQASAIVTDEGGSLCHAAIISRELGMPCVIGTKIATKVFKDGDFVEVDADKGVVKKISKKQYEDWIKELEKKEASVEVSKIPEEKLEVEIRPDKIAWFNSISKEDLPLVGGKGANLGEMFGKFPIPNGFCITVNAYKEFLIQNKLEEKIFPSLKKLNIEKTEELEKESKRVRDLILKADMPEDVKTEIKENYRKLKQGFVAVRSSATAEDLPTASFAGQLDTYMDVKGKDDLLDSVKRCWASLFTSRAIYYRVINKFHHEKVLICVVVQEMIDSEVAGVMFTVNPVTADRNEIIIEGNFGLGESVVSGQVTPDSFIVTKKPLEIKETTVNEKSIAIVKDKEKGHIKKIELDNVKANTQCLSEKEVMKLAKLGIKIEKHYNKPQDIEWAVGPDKKLYILQSRPITTLQDEEDKNKGKIDLGHLNDYQRLFQVINMPYVLSHIFMDHYKTLNGLSVFSKNRWLSFLPKKIIKKTLLEGLEIISDSKKFDEYSTRFEIFKASSTRFLDKIVSKDKISKQELSKSLELASGFFFYYSKTEFFYTDKAFLNSKKNKTINKNLHQMGKIKFKGREYLNKIGFGKQSYLTQILNIVAKQFDIDFSTLLQYDKEELLDLFNGKEVDLNIIIQRKKAYLMKGDGENLLKFFGNEIEGVVNTFLHDYDTKSNIFKGITANKGNISSKVKLIHYNYEKYDNFSHLINEMDKGDILVTETTSPELMLACKKAGAILTSQGGLMSHAAIVSRELNIPCIVGLGNITEVLKDGDIVEVDANKGVVRKVK